MVTNWFHRHSLLEYAKTFGLMVKLTIVRLLLSLVSFKNWRINHLYVSNSFLYGMLDEHVFMEQPQHFIDQKFPNHAYPLKKSLYGIT